MPGKTQKRVVTRKTGSDGEKAAPKPSEVAKVRRGGATWQQTRDHFGVKTSSGAFTKALNGAGFDAAGLKLDGSGPRESKAKTKKSPAPKPTAAAA